MVWFLSWKLRQRCSIIALKTGNAQILPTIVTSSNTGRQVAGRQVAGRQVAGQCRLSGELSIAARVGRERPRPGCAGGGTMRDTANDHAAFADEAPRHLLQVTRRRLRKDCLGRAGQRGGEGKAQGRAVVPFGETRPGPSPCNQHRPAPPGGLRSGVWPAERDRFAESDPRHPVPARNTARHRCFKVAATSHRAGPYIFPRGRHS